jgi:hypothetical protein
MLFNIVLFTPFIVVSALPDHSPSSEKKLFGRIEGETGGLKIVFYILICENAGL